MANRVIGKVTLISVQDEATLIRLDVDKSNGPERPLQGLYKLLNTDPNFNARYTLALTAAVNRLPLLIRTRGDIDPTQHSGIRFMLVTWGDDDDDLD